MEPPWSANSVVQAPFHLGVSAAGAQSPCNDVALATSKSGSLHSLQLVRRGRLFDPAWAHLEGELAAGFQQAMASYWAQHAHIWDEDPLNPPHLQVQALWFLLCQLGRTPLHVGCGSVCNFVLHDLLPCATMLSHTEDCAASH